MKKLSELLNGITVLEKNAGKNPDPIVHGLAYDSRSVKENFLFFALPGTHVNGNHYTIQAIKNGATAIVYQGQLPAETLKESEHLFETGKSVVFIKVTDARFAMSPISEIFYEKPSSKLVIIGVTGTEGKSTTVSLIWQLLRFAGKKAGFISTVEYSLGKEALENPEHQTTPEAPVIQEKLSRMVQNGCEYAVVESSSHGLSKLTNRLGNVLFDGAAFMNVTHEHLEFHGSHEQYKSDKANLFRALDVHSHNKTPAGKPTKVPALGAINLEDPSAQYFAEATKHEVIGFCAKPDISIPQQIQKYLLAKDIESDAQGVSFIIQEQSRVPGTDNFAVLQEIPLRINLPGTFNVYNTMAAMIITSKFTEISLKNLSSMAKGLTPVRGRMTAVNKGQDFEVIVDYAHTPSSFETIFAPLSKRAKGKIISLFGSGGERDVKKRPQQGKIAALYSHIVILTDEDPRGEDSMELLEMIAAGCPEMERNKSLFLIPDRPSAIRKAFSLAKSGDIVLLLGKGHENSIIYKNHTMPYDEIAEAESALKEMGFKISEQEGKSI